jgi:hypothetical protein
MNADARGSGSEMFFERENPTGSSSVQITRKTKNMLTKRIIRVLSKQISAKDKTHTQQWHLINMKTMIHGSAGLFLSRDLSLPDPHVSVRIVRITIPEPYQYRYLNDAY